MRLHLNCQSNSSNLISVSQSTRRQIFDHSERHSPSGDKSTSPTFLSFKTHLALAIVSVDESTQVVRSSPFSLDIVHVLSILIVGTILRFPIHLLIENCKAITDFGKSARSSEVCDKAQETSLSRIVDSNPLVPGYLPSEISSLFAKHQFHKTFVIIQRTHTIGPRILRRCHGSDSVQIESH